MRLINKFFTDISKNFGFTKYSAKAELKSEVAGSHLYWLWWVLEPLGFMAVYYFIVKIVFKTGEPYLPVFVFIGLTLWDYFNRMLTSSIKLIGGNKNILTKVYIAKYILLVSKSFVYAFKMLVSLVLVFCLMAIMHVPLSIHILEFPFVFLVLYVVTFGFSIILMHFGVFIEDLQNLITIALKLVFYLSGIFYSISQKVPAPYNRYILLVNPIGGLINEARNTLIYGQPPNYYFLLGWLAVGLILTYIGAGIIIKYENTYAKVI